jgi:hypothetical protein
MAGDHANWNPSDLAEASTSHFWVFHDNALLALQSHFLKRYFFNAIAGVVQNMLDLQILHKHLVPEGPTSHIVSEILEILYAGFISHVGDIDRDFVALVVQMDMHNVKHFHWF